MSEDLEVGHKVKMITKLTIMLVREIIGKVGLVKVEIAGKVRIIVQNMHNFF